MSAPLQTQAANRDINRAARPSVERGDWWACIRGIPAACSCADRPAITLEVLSCGPRKRTATSSAGPVGIAIVLERLTAQSPLQMWLRHRAPAQRPTSAESCSCPDACGARRGGNDVGSRMGWLGHRARADVVLRQPGGVTRVAARGGEERRSTLHEGIRGGWPAGRRAQLRFLRVAIRLERAASTCVPHLLPPSPFRAVRRSHAALEKRPALACDAVEMKPQRPLCHHLIATNVPYPPPNVNR